MCQLKNTSDIKDNIDYKIVYILPKIINNSQRKYERNECLTSVFIFGKDTAELLAQFSRLK